MAYANMSKVKGDFCLLYTCQLEASKSHSSQKHYLLSFYSPNVGINSVAIDVAYIFTRSTSVKKFEILLCVHNFLFIIYALFKRKLVKSTSVPTIN